MSRPGVDGVGGEAVLDAGGSQYPVSPPGSVRARRLPRETGLLVSYWTLARFRGASPGRVWSAVTSLLALEHQ